MLFHKPEFLACFVAVVAVLALLRENALRKHWLLAASYLFCFWASGWLTLVLVAETLVTFEAGRRIAAAPTAAGRKGWLAAAIAVDLSLLAWFKYASFLSENALWLSHELGFGGTFRPLDIALPLGISFYTLQAIGYAIDVYRRPARATNSLGDLALYLAFFVRLPAGPILRSAAFLPQLAAAKPIAFDVATLFLFVQGLVKKLVIADNLKPFVDAIFEGDVARWPSIIVWAAIVAFTVQMYCDFSGYTDMAIALGRALGYRLPPNFDFPFFARNPPDFWRRWHVSFSSWLRDYIYVSLPGSQQSVVIRSANILITMVLAGLWHGPAWTFVMWGVAHGIYLAVHDVYATMRRRLDPGYRPATGRVATVLSTLAMQLGMVLAMVFLAARDVSSAFAILGKLVFFDFLLRLTNMTLSDIQASRSIVLVGTFALLHWLSYRAGGLDRWLARAPVPVATGICVALGFVLYCLWPLDEPPFFYQRF